MSLLGILTFGKLGLSMRIAAMMVPETDGMKNTLRSSAVCCLLAISLNMSWIKNRFSVCVSRDLLNGHFNIQPEMCGYSVCYGITF